MPIRQYGLYKFGWDRESVHIKYNHGQALLMQPHSVLHNTLSKYRKKGREMRNVGVG